MVIFPFSCIVSATKDSEPGITVTYFEGWWTLHKYLWRKNLCGYISILRRDLSPLMLVLPCYLLFFCCCCSRRNRVYIAILVIMSVCCSLVNGFWQGDVERLSIGKKVKQWMFDQVVIYNNNDNSDPSHPTLDIVHLR